MNARPAVSALLLLTLSRASVAQELRGTVRESVNRQPIAGAVLEIRDSAGVVLGRNISNERGQYRIALEPRIRTVRALRIGFRPSAVHVPRTSSSVETLDIVMAAIPTMLEPVRVSDDSRCPRRPDGPAALGLWQQARTGLLATVVARAVEPASMKRLGYRRAMDGTSERIVRQQVLVDSSRTTSIPFMAVRSGDDFVKHGFANDSADVWTFFGPDADILLGESFARGYCFRIMEPAPSRPNQIGLGFAAAQHQRGVTEIDGALWIDTAARVIKDIEYRYRGLDRPVEVLRPGGFVSFREMSNGIVLIERWKIRAIGVVPDTIHDGRTDPLVRPRYISQESGGELARATWGDGAQWRGSLGRLRLAATRRSGRPAAGSVIQLVDTDYKGTVDSTGHLEIEDLVPGPYSVAIVDPELAAVGVIPTSLTFVAERDSLTHLSVAVPTVEEFVADACIGVSKSLMEPLSGTAWVFGRVIDTTGRSVEGLHWSISARSGQHDWRPVVDSRLSSSGLFQFCKLDLGTTIQVKVWRNAKTPHVFVRDLREKITILPLEISPP